MQETLKRPVSTDEYAEVQHVKRSKMDKKNLSLKCKSLNSNQYIDEKDKGISKNAKLTDKHIQMTHKNYYCTSSSL